MSKLLLWRSRPQGDLRRLKSLAGATALAGGAFLAWTFTAAASLPGEGFADLVEKVSPAVVYISSTHEASAEQGPAQMPFPVLPGFEQFFQQFGQPQDQGPVTALGSGFLIDKDGDIVTNNHVVEGADSIQVKLPDGHSYDATVVGTEPQTDLALLKIQADEPLPYVSFADSDKLRVGDIVVAVGNPYGLGGTVTAGIVSARGRDINAGPYDDFIQTDAAINRGNSGGPLFNTAGEVVGINSAIYSPNGGSVGIGFAIPANLAKQVIEDLEAHGEVARGWLGVKIQPVSDEIAAAVGLDKAQGAMVVEVLPDSPAAAAHLEKGDIILALGNQPIGEVRDLTRAVAAAPIGQEAGLEIWRQGKAMNLTVDIARLENEQHAKASEAPDTPASSDILGAQLASLTDDLRQQMDLPQDTTGVAILALDPRGQGARQGLRVGDVIERVGDSAVISASDIDQALAQQTGGAAVLLVRHGQAEHFLGLKLAKS